ncbi:MAG: CPBP family intramembrane metalloprotease, partial [Chloroflexi bacterium]|nr:CPBP family intramembrane metalloprotease [Chloroflexota bacterium]
GVAYEGGFVDRYLAPIVYPGPLTRQEQVLLGIAVVAVNAVIYVFVLFRRKAVARAFGGPARAPGPFGALGAVLPRSPFWAAIAVESGVVLVALALGSLMGYPPLHQIQLEGRGFLWGIGAVLPVALAVILASHRRLAFAVRLLDTLEDTLQPLLAGSVGRLAVISAVAGVGEEALFRGVVQSAAGAALGPWGGLLVASLFFGAAHLVSRTYAVMAMGFGLYLGWLLIVFDNLLVQVVDLVIVGHDAHTGHHVAVNESVQATPQHIHRLLGHARYVDQGFQGRLAAHHEADLRDALGIVTHALQFAGHV